MPTKFTGVDNVGRSDVQVFPPESLSLIILGPNMRDEEDYGDLGDFARELFDPNGPGQLQPGVVRKDSENRPVLVAGFRRLAAIKLGNINPSYYGGTSQLPFKATAIRCNDEEALIFNLRENRQRKDLSPVSLAKAARYLSEQRGWNNLRIAEAMNFSVAHIGRLLGYLDLPEEARQALHAELINQHFAWSLRGLPEKEIVEVVKEVTSGKLTNQEAVHKVNTTKRARGTCVAVTRKEFVDQLRARQANPAKKHFRLAFDLETYLTGDSNTGESLDDILDRYDLSDEDLEQYEPGEVEDGEVAAYEMRGGKAVPVVS